MATVFERTQESTVGGAWVALVRQLERYQQWLLVGAYGAVYAAAMVGASTVAVAVGAILPGAVGVVAFFTVGLGLVAAAPVAARRFAIRALDALATAPPA